MTRLVRSLSRPARAALLSIIAFWALVSSANANLNPGDIQYNPAVNPPFVPSYTLGPVPAAYNVLVQSTVFPYLYQAGDPAKAYNGFVTSNVFKNGSGQLAFSYVFNNLNAPPAITEITRATINDPSNPWTGISIFAAGSDSSGLSTAVPGAFGSWTNGNPFDVQRDGVDQGISVVFNSFNSGTELASPSNDRSAVIWFATDASHYRRTNVGLIDGGTVGSGDAYAPVVPEPSTFVLSALACFGIAVMARRRARRR